MGTRTALADALHQAGQLAEAEAAFREAEEMQKANQPEFPLLYTLQGFRYCDLLLSQGKVAEVQRRVAKFFEWRLPGDSLLGIALENLSLGRAYLIQVQVGAHRDAPLRDAATYLDRAVDGLRQAGQQIYQPLGLLVRAELRRVTGELDKARRDLDEAFSIATRGGMRLFEAGCHLEYARWYLAANRGDAMAQAREHLAIAKQMIEEMGYHRRDQEVKELEGRFAP
jgi:tetratricopeptide (TPR) repeat protein